MSKIRKWRESYVSYGFTKVAWNGRDCAYCLHCSVLMSNASLRPSKLKNYGDKKHSRNKDDDTMLCPPKEYDTIWKRHYPISDLG